MRHKNGPDENTNINIGRNPEQAVITARTLESISRCVTGCLVSILLSVHPFDHAEELDKGVTFIAAGSFAGRRRFGFKQCIEVAAISDHAGQLVKTRFGFGHGAIRSISLGCHFGIKRDRLAFGDHHASPISQRQNHFGAIAGDDNLAFTDDIPGFQTTQITCAVAGECFTGNGRDFGNDGSLGHDDTPKWIGDTS